LTISFEIVMIDTNSLTVWLILGVLRNDASKAEMNFARTVQNVIESLRRGDRRADRWCCTDWNCCKKTLGLKKCLMVYALYGDKKWQWNTRNINRAMEHASVLVKVWRLLNSTAPKVALEELQKWMLVANVQHWRCTVCHADQCVVDGQPLF